MGKDIQMKRFSLGNYRRALLCGMIQKWGRARFFLSKQHFLVKIPSAKLTTFILQHA